MSEPYQIRAVFKSAVVACACCNAEYPINRFLLNGCADGRVLVTFACAYCAKVVQVYADGESVENGGSIQLGGKPDGTPAE